LKSIQNKTHRPLRIHLPQGKTMHLGPNQTGQISPHAVDHPPIVKLVEAGEIEIFDAADPALSTKQGPIPSSRQGHPAVTGRHTTGDR